MKKVFEMEDLDCANCAAKIQDQILKLDGVNDAKVNFMLLKFTLDADDDKFDDALAESIRIFDKVEPDCEVLA
jgi:copper chaperone CopZ